MKNILIIDTKAGNLFSLQSAIERLGFAVTILESASDAKNEQPFDAVVIPGQGRFATVLENIRARGWPDYLEQTFKANIPMLGICVGMQIFFEASEEDPDAKGLGWLEGRARALDFPKKPMVGWAQLDSDYWKEAIVYFVNSYAVKSSDVQIASTTYGENFCAAIKTGSLTGVQFHPEKSGEKGAEIIKRALTNTLSGNGVTQDE